MSLTQNDLQAIQQIVQTTVQPMIDDAVDTLAQSTAAGFTEAHEKLDALTAGQNRIENKLDPTIEQVEDHAMRLKVLEPKTA